MPSSVRAAIESALDNAHAYPPPEAVDLRRALAVRYGQSPEEFALVPGLTSLFHALPRLRRFSPLILQTPCFSEVQIGADKAGVPVRLSGHILECPEPGSAVYVALPDSPRGHAVEVDRVCAWVTQHPDVLWIVDEAFVDFLPAGSSMLDVFSSLPDNLLVLRSFTKFYGLASLRVGLVAGSADWSQHIRGAFPPWSLSGPAIAAARACLDLPKSWADERRSWIQHERSFLRRSLQSLPLVSKLSGSANYLCFEWGGRTELAAFCLQRHGILIRDCSNFPGMSTSATYRVSVRSRSDNVQLVRAVRAAQEEGVL